MPRRRPASLDGFASAARRRVAAYRRDYSAYFERNNARRRRPRTSSTSVRAWSWCPASACSASARRQEGRKRRRRHRRDHRRRDHRRRSHRPLRAAAEADIFDVEYWSLEQAKLGKASQRSCHGRPGGRVTGAAGDHRPGHRPGLRRRGRRGRPARPRPGRAQASQGARRRCAGPACDVTDAASVDAAFARSPSAFGGVDIVVSNAGAAWQGRIGEVDEATLRESFELNFYGHQRVAQAAVRIMQAQGTGGCLLFNVSKQAVNPGPDFGPYGLPKAATLALMRQYAVDHGDDGIRSNAVNADRIRSGLLDRRDDRRALEGARRSASRTTWRGNLLGREVTADDVAQAFVALALAQDHRRRPHRRRRQYRRRAAVSVPPGVSATRDAVGRDHGARRSSASMRGPTILAARPGRARHVAIPRYDRARHARRCDAGRRLLCRWRDRPWLTRGCSLRASSASRSATARRVVRMRRANHHDRLYRSACCPHSASSTRAWRAASSSTLILSSRTATLLAPPRRSFCTAA